jgi:hypothetical protein
MRSDSRFDALLERELDTLPVPPESEWMPPEASRSTGLRAVWVISGTVIIVAAAVGGAALREWRQDHSLVASSASVNPRVYVRVLQPNESFDPLPEPVSPSISEQRAVSLAQVGLTGTLTSVSAQYGHLHSAQLGSRTDREAWFVILEGLARPAPSGGPSSNGPRRTFVFIDASDGSSLISVSEGAGPPLP